MNDVKAYAAELAAKVVRMTEADQAEALVMTSDLSLTRFAKNRIHQNVSESDTQVSVRAVMGKRQGVASTNRLDEESLSACCAKAVDFATAATEDPDFPGLPGPADVAQEDRVAPSTMAFDAQARAEAARAMIDQSASRGLTAAGAVRVNIYTLAIANSLGTNVVATNTGMHVTVLSSGPSGGSGWASFTGKDASDLAAAALGDEAATLAERSSDPGELEPGTYPVVLGPEAVADILSFLGYVGFSAKAVEEGRSFMSGKFGERLLSESVTVVDDASAEHAMGPTFDFEGVPKRRVELISAGKVGTPVTDSYWAAKTGRENTGHALPAPNPYGPMPLNLEMAAGEDDIDEMIRRVERGVYVTRFHYTNIEDPIPVTLTGMTRDGTFMIEDGRLTRPLKNLRFTQSIIEALSDVRGITTERRFVGSESDAVYVPGLYLGGFAFTGQTD